MIVNNLVEELKKVGDGDKKVLVQLPDGSTKKISVFKHVKDKILYLFLRAECQFVLTVDWLKSILEEEAADDCWSHKLFDDDGSRFENCGVMLADSTSEEFKNGFDGQIYSLLPNLIETEDAIILICEKEKQSRTVKTNMGEIPIEDYLDIKAQQCGFDNYKDLRSQGFSITV